MLKGNAHYLANKCQPYADTELEIESAQTSPEVQAMIDMYAADPFVETFYHPVRHFDDGARKRRQPKRK